MKTKWVLLLALSVGGFGKLAVAQSAQIGDQRPQVQYAVFHPAEGNSVLQPAAWDRDRDHDRDDHRWRDRDHDRDDHRWRDRDRDRDDRWRWRERRYPSATANNGWWRNGNGRNNGYWGRNNGWYGNNGGWYGNTANNGRYGQRGEYNRNGEFHPFGTNGYYDRDGKWHNGGGWWR